MLSSLNRLPSSDISPILRAGIRVRGEYIDFMYKQLQSPSRFALRQERRTPLANARFAVIVSAKVDKRATARNRMKRLVREAVQHLLPSIQQGVCGVFVVRSRLPDTMEAVALLVRRLLGQKHLLRETLK